MIWEAARFHFRLSLSKMDLMVQTYGPKTLSLPKNIRSVETYGQTEPYLGQKLGHVEKSFFRLKNNDWKVKRRSSRLEAEFEIMLNKTEGSSLGIDVETKDLEHSAPCSSILDTFKLKYIVVKFVQFL